MSGQIEEDVFQRQGAVPADRLAATPPRRVSDLPGGASRLVSDPVGIPYVFVNGVPIVEASQLNASLPGALLRSGRDTRSSTVTEESRLPGAKVVSSPPR